MARENGSTQNSACRGTPVLARVCVKRLGHRGLGVRTQQLE